MPTWYIALRGDSQGNLRTEKRKYNAAQFDATAKANEFEGHEVIGMWVIDHETPDVDVIKFRGDHVPADIRDRFKAWEKRKVGCI